MNKKGKKAEKFKIYDYSDVAILLPVDEEYEEVLFFFAGFNENASKYIYLIKLYLESLPRLAIKVIIPYLPKYPKEDCPTYWMRKPEMFSHVTSWFAQEIINLPEGFEYKIIPNLEKDSQVMKMVWEEIEKLGSSEKIIFMGFSMGGRYLLEILTKMKIKTKFNLIMKTFLLDYINPYANDSDDIFNSNIFYMYYSIFDKVVQFNRGIAGITKLKNQFKQDNVFVSIDNGKKHEVDDNCLDHMASLFKKYKLRPKF